jgi:chromate transporter
VNELLELLLVFGRLSLVGFGGSSGVFPELERVVVDQQGWLTRRELVDSFALGQLTPGPALLMVMFIGHRVAGLSGALVALFANFVPSALLSALAVAHWDRLRQSPWLAALQRSLAAVALGLSAAGACSVCRVAITDPTTATVTLLACLTLWQFRLPPALVILGGAVVAALLAAARGLGG